MLANSPAENWAGGRFKHWRGEIPLAKGIGVLQQVRAKTVEPVCRVRTDGCPRTLGMAIRCLEELDLATAVVARALLSELGGTGDRDSGRPLEYSVAVTPRQLLSYGAVQEVCRYVDDVDGFLGRQVTVLRDVTFLPVAGIGAPLPHTDEVALFNIVEVREWRDANDETTAVHWMVRGGLWAGSHLRQACRGALCRIAHASLDTKRESAASMVFRIGALAMADACPSSERKQITMSVESLLAAVGRLPAPQLRISTWGSPDDRGPARRGVGAACRGFFQASGDAGIAFEWGRLHRARSLA